MRLLGDLDCFCKNGHHWIISEVELMDCWNNFKLVFCPFCEAGDPYMVEAGSIDIDLYLRPRLDEYGKKVYAVEKIQKDTTRLGD